MVKTASKSNSARLRIVTLVGAFAALLLAVAFYAWHGDDVDSAPAVTAIDADDAELVALGRHVYAQQCAACHGAMLEGQRNWRERKPDGRLPAPPHDATGHTWHHDDATLFALTKYGIAAITGQPVQTDMPVYDGVLTDREIRAALAFIKSTWPPRIRDSQAELNRR